VRDAGGTSQARRSYAPVSFAARVTKLLWGQMIYLDDATEPNVSRRPLDKARAEAKIAREALSLVSRLGIKARQHVVDAILKAIRDNDISEAKRWDDVGRAVDLLLSDRPPQPHASAAPS
jgi:hypothetical protein